MVHIDLYFHPTCATSWRVLKFLHREKLLEEINTTDVTMIGPSKSLYGIWSVPWVTIKGKPAATDPIKPEEVRDILEGSAAVPRHRASAFIRTVLHSLLASALMYIHNSIKPLLDEGLVSAAMRSPLGGPSPKEVISELEEQENSIVERWLEDTKYTLAMGYVRTLYWVSGGKEEAPSDREIGTWLLAAASVGRSGLPHKPQLIRDKIRDLTEYVEGNIRSLMEDVKKEQELIMNDEEYWGIVKSMTH